MERMDEVEKRALMARLAASQREYAAQLRRRQQDEQIAKQREQSSRPPEQNRTDPPDSRKEALKALAIAAKSESPIAEWMLMAPKVVCALLDIHPKTLNRWTKSGAFPKPIEMPGRLVRWRLSEIDEWIKARSAK